MFSKSKITLYADCERVKSKKNDNCERDGGKIRLRFQASYTLVPQFDNTGCTSLTMLLYWMLEKYSCSEWILFVHRLHCDTANNRNNRCRCLQCNEIAQYIST